MTLLQSVADTTQAAIGVSPVIYTSNALWNGAAGGSTAFSTKSRPRASLGVVCPTIPLAWSTWTLWQNADNGNVPGIPFSADLDQSNGPALPNYSDTTPPVLTLPSTITTDATSPQGAVVSYSVRATIPIMRPAS